MYAWIWTYRIVLHTIISYNVNISVFIYVFAWKLSEIEFIRMRLLQIHHWFQFDFFFFLFFLVRTRNWNKKYFSRHDINVSKAKGHGYGWIGDEWYSYIYIRSHIIYNIMDTHVDYNIESTWHRLGSGNELPKSGTQTKPKENRETSYDNLFTFLLWFRFCCVLLTLIEWFPTENRKPNLSIFQSYNLMWRPSIKKTK